MYGKGDIKDGCVCVLRANMLGCTVYLVPAPDIRICVERNPSHDIFEY